MTMDATKAEGFRNSAKLAGRLMHWSPRLGNASRDVVKPLGSLGLEMFVWWLRDLVPKLRHKCRETCVSNLLDPDPYPKHSNDAGSCKRHRLSQLMPDY